MTKQKPELMPTYEEIMVSIGEKPWPYDPAYNYDKNKDSRFALDDVPSDDSGEIK